MNNKVVLVVMDGWGEALRTPGNAIAAAKTPFVDSLYQNYPHCQLLTSGENVGLPDGQMGNSEVGHLNLGAGRVVYQELALINKAVREKTINQSQIILNTFNYCRENNKDLHLFGLVSDGGVHSHLNHLIHLCKMASDNGLSNIFIHAFTDGRDTDPKSGFGYIEHVENAIAGTGAKIASVIGRYYAMDRDKRWERVKKAYDLLVHATGIPFLSATETIAHSYQAGITDEFIHPSVIVENNKPIAVIKDGDAVISFNFRTDRCREITQVLTQQDRPEDGMKKMHLHYVTMSSYDRSFNNVNVVYEKDNLSNTLGEILSKAGKTQLRIAETEKYPHVTFFFSGGREDIFTSEERIMIQSPKVSTYDLRPEMSAYEVKDALINELKIERFDFVCLNLANADMVGHTGVFDAVVKAVETVDQCVAEIVQSGLEHGYSFIITADHGNADLMINEDGTPNTAHTTNPVPCFLIAPSQPMLGIKNGKLADIAPTILQLLNVDIPAEMTGSVLVEKKIKEQA